MSRLQSIEHTEQTVVEARDIADELREELADALTEKVEIKILNLLSCVDECSFIASQLRDMCSERGELIVDLQLTCVERAELIEELRNI